MKRPYVICHMTTTVDGKIKPTLWPKDTNIHRLYESCHKKLKGDGWIIGRTSMQGFSSSKIKLPKTKGTIIKRDFVGDLQAQSFAIVIDRAGKCLWDSNSITGDHVIEILSENVSNSYLEHLQQKKVSYIFAGKKEIDLSVALKKLKSLFGIKRLLLEGGGIINGSFLKSKLIDELSQLVMPYADGSTETPTLFDVEKGYTKRPITKMKLASVKRLEGGVLWLRYKISDQKQNG